MNEEVQVLVCFVRIETPKVPGNFVYLQEVGGRRVFPIVVDKPQAGIIQAKFTKAPKFLRPLSHDLILNVIQALGGKVTRVLITNISGETYYAKIILDAGGRHLEIDSRPSDAIVLALEAEVTIWVDKRLFDQIAVWVAPHASKSIGGAVSQSAEPKITEKELAPYADVIKQLADSGKL